LTPLPWRAIKMPSRMSVQPMAISQPWACGGRAAAGNAHQCRR
jgi:hypothetical protein